MASSRDTEFWNRLLRAIGAEPRDEHVLRGASGIDHRVLALGVDERRNRLILISSEHTARAAAMMQVDIQATLSATNVIVARPVVFGLPALAQRLIAATGVSKLSLKQLTSFLPEGAQEEKNKYLDKHVAPLIGGTVKAFELVPLDILPQIFDAVRQLSEIDFKSVEWAPNLSADDLVLDFSKLANRDLCAEDRQFGTCAIPFFSFQETDWKVFQDGHPDDVEGRLREMGIFQFFYPSPDHVALGLVERGLNDKEKIDQQLALLPSIGHPIGAPEIIPPETGILDVLDALRDRGLLAEGEISLEISEPGKNVRGTVRYKPREGVLSKLLNKVGITLNVTNKFN